MLGNQLSAYYSYMTNISGILCEWVLRRTPKHALGILWPLVGSCGYWISHIFLNLDKQTKTQGRDIHIDRTSVIGEVQGQRDRNTSESKQVHTNTQTKTLAHRKMRPDKAQKNSHRQRCQEAMIKLRWETVAHAFQRQQLNYKTLEDEGFTIALMGHVTPSSEAYNIYYKYMHESWA